MLVPALVVCQITQHFIQDPEEVITDLQKELFKAQGIDGVWGIKCLGQVGDTYQDDTEFMRLFVSSVER